MSVTTTCRDVAELKPVAQAALKLLVQECVKAGITNIFVTETYRSPTRQKYLYEQGRTRPGQKVTWTLNSNHSGRLAWDIAISPPATLYDVATLNKVGAIARRLGITWGGDWAKNIDRPHFEIKSSWQPPQGYKLEGEVVIPTDSKQQAQLIKKQSDQQHTLHFTSITLKSQLDTRLASPASHKLVDAAAVKHLGNTSKLNNGTMADGDFIASCVELAVFYAKKDK